MNKETAVELRGKGLPAAASRRRSSTTRRSRVHRVEAGSAGTVQAEVGGEAGTVGLKIIRPEGAGDGAIARLVFRGKAAGISHLVFRGGPVMDAEGKPVPIEFRTSRIVVK